MTHLVVLAGLICCQVAMAASASEDSPKAAEGRRSAAVSTKALTPTKPELVAGATDKASDPQASERERAARIDHPGSGRGLTTRQKRLFVLGLYSAEMNK